MNLALKLLVAVLRKKGGYGEGVNRPTEASSDVFVEMMSENNDVTLGDKLRSFVKRIKLGLK